MSCCDPEGLYFKSCTITRALQCRVYNTINSQARQRRTTLKPNGSGNRITIAWEDPELSGGVLKWYFWTLIRVSGLGLIRVQG